MSQKDKVFAAADAIAARGEAVTQLAVRVEMGGGSFSTIGPLLKEWKAANPDADRPAEQVEDAPEAVQKVAAELVRRVWAEAQGVASVALEAMRQEVEDLRADTAAETAEMLEAMRVIESERDAAQAEGETLRQSLVDAREDARQASEARATAEANAIRETVRAEAAERETARADAAKAEADSRTAQAIAERDAARVEADEARKAGAAALDAERRAGAAALDEARKAGAEAVAELRERAAALREQVAALTGERDGLAERLADAEATAKAAEARAVEAETRDAERAAAAAVKPKAERKAAPAA